MFVRTMLLGAAASIAFAGAMPASADIISGLSGSPVAVSGGYAYTYDVQLSGGQIDPASMGASFGTIYDFGPVIGDITSTGLLQNFAFATSATNTPASFTAPVDSAASRNIRFTYTGNTGIAVAGTDSTFASSGTPYTTIAPGMGNLGTFTVVSPYPELAKPTLNYDGQSYKGTNGTVQGNVGFTSGPSAVPEASTWLMMLAGFGLVGLATRRRRAPSLHLA